MNEDLADLHARAAKLGLSDERLRTVLRLLTLAFQAGLREERSSNVAHVWRRSLVGFPESP